MRGWESEQVVRAWGGSDILGRLWNNEKDIGDHVVYIIDISIANIVRDIGMNAQYSGEQLTLNHKCLHYKMATLGTSWMFKI